MAFMMFDCTLRSIGKNSDDVAEFVLSMRVACIRTCSDP